MNQQNLLLQAFTKLHHSLNFLEDSIDNAFEQLQYKEIAEKEIQNLNSDRSRIAQELDSSEAQLEELIKTNKKVAYQIVDIMEKIRVISEE